jgi:hypothetical protein
VLRSTPPQGGNQQQAQGSVLAAHQQVASHRRRHQAEDGHTAEGRQVAPNFFQPLGAPGVLWGIGAAQGAEEPFVKALGTFRTDSVRHRDEKPHPDQYDQGGEEHDQVHAAEPGDDLTHV